MKKVINVVVLVFIISFLQGCGNDLVEKILMLERENQELKLKVAELEEQLSQKKSSFNSMFN